MNFNHPDYNTYIELSWLGIEISVKSDNISPTLQSLMEDSK